MTKRTQHPAGPANMKANYLVVSTDSDGVTTKKLHKGFAGFNGWAYHPTRGFKKVNGFKPSFVNKVAQTLEATPLLSEEIGNVI